MNIHSRKSGMWRRWSGWMLAGLALGAGAVVVCAEGGIGDRPQAGLWVPNGEVFCVADNPSRGSVYIGGSFTRISEVTGGGVWLGVGSGEVEINPYFDGGSVRAAVSDGSGGWFVGGLFRHVQGEERSYLVHILPDGSLDEAWSPELNGGVYALVLSPDGETLYVGGAFTGIGGQTRNRLAALGVADGALKTWNPNANNLVRTLALSPDGGRLYAGGDFTSIGGQSGLRLAALNTGDGPVLAWLANATHSVMTVALSADGSTLYAGGSFTNIRSTARSRIAALNTANGTVQSWNPSANSSVFALALSPDGQTLYAGGDFSTIGGQSRFRVAALSPTGNVARAWNPSGNGPAYVIHPTPDGQRVYVGGIFTSMGGQTRPFLAELDAGTALATEWDPYANGVVYAMALAPNGMQVFAGGEFSTLGGVSRPYLAELSKSTGQPTEWNPAPNSVVRALAVMPDGQTVVAGGGFTNVAGAARNRLAALRADTGAATDWDPDAGWSSVLAVALSADGSTVYAGGSFTNIGGAARSRLAALRADTGMATDWGGDADADVTVLLVSGDTVYAGGVFTNMGGVPRRGIAALRSDTGAVMDWNPGADAPVGALVLSPDAATVYAGGSFTNIGGASRLRLAALWADTGMATDWSPGAGGLVRALAVAADGSTVYAGGDFAQAGGVARYRLAELHAETGEATGWNPHVMDPASGRIHALVLDAGGGALHAGGLFYQMGGRICRNFTWFGTPETAGRADQAIDFPPLADQETTRLLELAATASSGLPVDFAILEGPAILDGGILAFTGTGMVRIAASQAGNAEWNPAPVVVRSFLVFRPEVRIEVSRNPVHVREGGEGRFFVRLTGEPEDVVDLAIEKVSGDSSIRVAPGPVRRFGKSNWNSWRMVVLTADADANASSETAVVRIRGVGLADVLVEAIVLDEDIGENLALASGGSRITGMRGYQAEAMIDGQHDRRDNYGYMMWTPLPQGTMTLDLNVVSAISRIRLLTWDWSHRLNRYRIEASVDGTAWTVLVDASGEGRHGWDDWAVDDVPARYLRLTGLSNSVPNAICLSEWEVYGERLLPAPLEFSKPQVNVREGGEGRFFVRMAHAPTQTVVYAVGVVGGDADVRVQTGSVTFTPASWQAWRVVALSAGVDGNAEDETATIRLSAPGYANQHVQARVLDVDIGVNLAESLSAGGISGQRAYALERKFDGVHADRNNYGYATWSGAAKGTMTMDLGAATDLSRIRLLNWDWTYRTHRYAIETSQDGKSWSLLVDAREDDRQGWDDWAVAATARYVRFVAYSNSANNALCISEWEVYAAPAGPDLPSRSARGGGANLPVSVLTSAGPDDETGWHAVDGDPETAWMAPAPGGYLVIGYEPELALSSIEIELADGSPESLQILHSLDAIGWTGLPDDLETAPVALNYLWLIFPDDGSGAVPGIREVRPNP